MSKIRIGIDPGKGSYICLMEEGNISFHQFPLIGTETDIKGIAEIFLNIWKGIEGSSDVHAVIENVHSVFGSSAGSNFEFGKIAGVLEALLYACDIPFTKVEPKAWQKEMWQGVPLQTKKSSTGKTQVNDTKAISQMAAIRLFPNLDLRDDSRKTDRAKKVDHNKVDALLIAEYCRRKF